MRQPNLPLTPTPPMQKYDIEIVPPDLTTPPATDGPPRPGQRVRQAHPDYAGSDVHCLLYLPTDWEADKRYPVIVEYAGNKWETSPGTVEGSNLGYGISAGQGVIWLCLPYVGTANGTNTLTWWGDVEATVAYCKQSVRRVCADYGGDADALVLAGFSRGSIACNFIGLHDDEIAGLWRGFICHSQYDGLREDWPYAGCDRTSARARLARLGNRPQFISQERHYTAVKAYLHDACPDGNFTFLDTAFHNHTDTFVLRDIPERDALRSWFADLIAKNSPDEHR